MAAAAAAAAAVPAPLVAQLVALLLPGEPSAGAAQLAERLRQVAAALDAVSAAASPHTLSDAGAAALPPLVAPPHGTGATDAGGADVDEGQAVEPAGGELQLGTRKRRNVPRPFDFSRYGRRYVALEIFYAGWNYHGFASQGCVRGTQRCAAGVRR